MENELFQAIKTQLETYVVTSGVSDFLTIKIWNNQLNSLRSEDENGNIYYNIDFPACFIEFAAPYEIQQLGNGNQIYDPLDIRVHIIHRQEDAGDGTFEQNVDVFALKQKVYFYLNKFEPSGSVAFVRLNEEPDYEHNNLYHFIQTYRTNYIDNSLNLPVSPVIINPPIDLRDTYNFTPGEPQ